MADALYEAMRETIGIPENDRFIVLDEHDASTLHIDPGFMGIERGPGAMVIEITLRRGRTDEKKQALYRRITERLQQAAGVRPEDVVIVLRENESADWSFGNGVAQYIVQ
jgi:phenylpyruvate tautomerase PptA (4-oxalocrotonate tautomerase family)